MSGAVETLARLVAFDTTSHRSNLEAIGFIRDRLEAAGATCRATWDDGRRKANLYATLGPADRPGLMLSGHTDVVPAEAGEWTSDPFALAERGGRLYARGSADMKGFIALCLALAPEFAAAGLASPVHFAFSYDEEVGCLGARRLIADMAAQPVRPRLCVVGEPTGLHVVAGHKARRTLACHVHGREAHSASDAGVNAIEAAARLIAHIGDVQERHRREGPFDPAYDPPYTTITTGVVAGGAALNITPRSCDFEYEIRALPSDDPDAIEREVVGHARDRIEPVMKARDPATGFTFVTTNDTPGFDLPDDHALVRMVAALTGDNAPGRVSFGTEAGLFNGAGVPTVVCGPGDIAQAHRPDEFIALEQIERGEALLRALVARVCG